MPEEKNNDEIKYDSTVFTLKKLQNIYAKNPESIINKEIKYYGWVRRIRTSAENIFIDLYDGTDIDALMCITSSAIYSGTNYINNNIDSELTDSDTFKILEYEQIGCAEFLSDGSAVVVEGIIVSSPIGATQTFEFQLYRLRVICGVENPNTYPINKTSEKNIVSLRQLPFMRVRSQVMQCIFKICSKLELAVHTFMDEQGVEKVDPNIITMSDCEGAGETFMVNPLIFSKNQKGENIAVGLTVSSQLPLESLITGLGSVYTAQKSFRAEKSDTNKHLAEFLHIEYEQAFITLPQLMDFTENFVKFVIKFTLLRCKKELDFLESKFRPKELSPTRNLLLKLLERPFVRIKHCDAVKLIQDLITNKTMLPDNNGIMKRIKVDKLPQFGEDIKAEHENLLVKWFGWSILTEEERNIKLQHNEEFASAVFVTHWPLKIKSFYMKQCDDDSGECESFDLLMPRVGEMFGGSMREWRYDKLMNEITARGMDISPLQWFLDLRKSGSMPHGGWGMGFARLCMLMTGVPSVRDVVAFPVYYSHCPY